jgi:hypothetical protein
MKNQLAAKYKAPVLLSLEEQAVAIAEEQEAKIEADAQAEVVDRISVIKQGAEDVNAITATIDNVTELDSELIAVVGDMAAAGTDAVPEELMQQVAQEEPAIV